MTRKRVLRISLGMMVVLLIALLSWGGYLYYCFVHAANVMYEPLPASGSLSGIEDLPKRKEAVQALGAASPSSNKSLAATSSTGQTDNASGNDRATEASDKRFASLAAPDLKKRDAFFILLLGVDERAGDKGRSDTMLLLGVNPQHESVEVLSIPRDTRVLIPKLEREDKINHAYAFGGTALSVASVERLLGVPIAYYIKTNMEGFSAIVDSLNGVDINNQQLAFTNLGYTFPLGQQKLDGPAALSYSRMRLEDPEGDFGRMERQRQVLRAIGDKVLDIGQASKLPGLMRTLSAYIRTNLTLSDMLNIAQGYRSTIGHIDTLSLSGAGKRIDGIYYWVVEPAERERVGQALLSGIEETDADADEIRQ